MKCNHEFELKDKQIFYEKSCKFCGFLQLEDIKNYLIKLQVYVNKDG